MRPTTYQRLTNASVLAAIFAALMFDRVSSVKWLFLIIGALSGAAAVMLYFVNQWRPDGKSSNLGVHTFPGKPITSENLLDVSKNDRLVTEHANESPSLGHIVAATVGGFNVWLDETMVKSLEKENWKLHLDNVFFPGLRQTYADEVVKIVCGVLSAREHEALEIQVAPDGTFTIRRNRRPAEEDLTQDFEERFAGQAILHEVEN